MQNPFPAVVCQVVRFGAQIWGEILESCCQFGSNPSLEKAHQGQKSHTTLDRIIAPPIRLLGQLSGLNSTEVHKTATEETLRIRLSGQHPPEHQMIKSHESGRT
mmetsp:Transcript_4022/g.7159  ORF Transcript_4022/g.7159 Transcript_4022/m.7159 type:complete len:104 (+) Transcript_4022:140-451(+)